MAARTAAATVVTLAAGLLVWVLLSQTAAGVREAWDRPEYFSIGIPLMGLATAVAGYLAPTRVWRWAISVAAGQAAGMFLVHPPGSDPGLLPVALIFVGVPLIALFTLAGLAGGAVARRGWDRELIG
jgi:hypothetical protein